MSLPARSRVDLARLLAQSAVDRASGILTAQRGKLKRLFCLSRGRLVYVASNVLEEQLAEYMVEHGLLDATELAAAKREAGQARQKPLDFLLHQGRVAPQALERSLAGLIESLLFVSLGWPDGDYTFEKGQPNLTQGSVVDLNPLELLLRYGEQQPQSLERVRVGIGPPDLRPQASPEAAKILDALDHSNPLIDELLEACDGSRTVLEVVGESSAEEETALRALHSLIRIGALVRPDKKSAPVKSRSAEPGLQEDEIAALLRRVGGDPDHYLVLGLEREANQDRIRRAYYNIARRYHPDRFRSGPLMRFLSEMEAYFTQVTEAYNTLSNPEAREEYERQLREQKAAQERVDTDPAMLARQNYLRAKELIKRRRFTDAVQFLENAIQLEAGQALYHLELGKLLAANPRHRREAEGSLKEAARLDPSAIETYLVLGELLHKTGRRAEARQMFEEALRWEPDSVEARQRLRQLDRAS